ncbi:hypothetical protein DFH11DRAFT_917092 [Phellopilus nigrolimitatus]|nr:hypothetical protein DFH11DRAFT_917092 [Phellopilus nigrolimitatus]
MKLGHRKCGAYAGAVRGDLQQRSRTRWRIQTKPSTLNTRTSQYLPKVSFPCRAPLLWISSPGRQSDDLRMSFLPLVRHNVQCTGRPETIPTAHRWVVPPLTRLSLSPPLARRPCRPRAGTTSLPSTPCHPRCSPPAAPLSRRAITRRHWRCEITGPRGKRGSRASQSSTPTCRSMDTCARAPLCRHSGSNGDEP